MKVLKKMLGLDNNMKMFLVKKELRKRFYKNLR